MTLGALADPHFLRLKRLELVVALSYSMGLWNRYSCTCFARDSQQREHLCPLPFLMTFSFSRCPDVVRRKRTLGDDTGIFKCSYEQVLEVHKRRYGNRTLLLWSLSAEAKETSATRTLRIGLPLSGAQ